MSRAIGSRAFSNRNRFSRIEEGEYVPRNPVKKAYRVSPAPYSVIVAEMVKQANFGFSGGFNPVSKSATPAPGLVNLAAVVKDARKLLRGE